MYRIDYIPKIILSIKLLSLQSIFLANIIIEIEAPIIKQVITTKILFIVLFH
jgi:hypothetical protein